jgi:glutaconate CoA-transferase subunit A
MTKVTSLSEAIATIHSGSHISLSGFAITRCTMAAAAEILRQGITKLTVSQCVGAMDADLLVGGGAVKRLIYGGGSLDRFGRLNNINASIEKGKLIAEEYSSLSIAFRYLAGSLGLPFIPIRSLLGSDLLRRLEQKLDKDVARLVDPFTGEDWLVLRPLIPDVAIIQVQAADRDGNAWIKGPRWDNVEQAKAAKRTILITEKLISTEEIRKYPEQTVIPALLVSHVVVLPFSAHPTSVYGVYDYDSNQIKKYVEATKSPESFKAYLDAYVYSVKDHTEYMEKAGGKKLMKSIQANPELGY